ncbi:MAG: glycerophosphodiester phosphodiesterase [Ignavibacteriaceae bacterium]
MKDYNTKLIVKNRIKPLIYFVGVISMTMNIYPQVITTAHRGASGYAPENTLSAVVKAVEMGAGFCEIDVQETSDGILILMHDSNYKRTCGVSKNVWEVSYEETKTFDCGKWFNNAFAGEKVPRLDEIIDYAKGKIRLNIELKTNGHEKLLVERVLDLLTIKDFFDQVIITSFDFSLIDKVKQIQPGIKAGYIFSKIGEVNVFKSNVDLLSVNKSMVTKDFVKRAKENGKEVHVWTVNDPAEMEKLINFEVTNIITNFPDKLRTILGREK